MSHYLIGIDPGASGALVLPWPDRVLHPNARPHFIVLAKARKAARAYAACAAKNAWSGRNFPETGRLHLWIDFYPPDKRRRDDDGLLSSMKAARDGIADALGIDDSRFVSHPYIKDQTYKGGKVEIRITVVPPESQS